MADGVRESVAIEKGRSGLFGVKAGFTQVYNDEGASRAVTVIYLPPNVITQIKTKAKEGYSAVQVGILEKASKKLTKAAVGHLKASGAGGFHFLGEIRLESDQHGEGAAVGKVLSPGFLKAGDFVDLTAISKGKGFQGVMKRHGFAGGFKSHGCSVSHRAPGSIGNRMDPARVFKGKKMAGQMGRVQKTIQSVEVVRVDSEQGLLLVNGSVPGPRSGVVAVRRAIKKGNK